MSEPVVNNDNELKRQCLQLAQSAHQASVGMVDLEASTIDQWLRRASQQLVARQAEILAANQRDLDQSDQWGLSDAQVDRLRLTPSRVDQMAHGLSEVAALPSPVGEVLDASRRPNGLRVSRVRVPLGVVFFIYESRPNVTADAAALCLKSGNAVILRGGKEAAHSNQAIFQILREVAADSGLPPEALQRVATSDRRAVGELLTYDDWIDVVIPRGGESLIRRVVAEARMPVIKHFDGNCHVYLHEDAPTAMALEIAINSKCQRMGVCNACETIVIHQSRVSELAPRLAEQLRTYQVRMYADPLVRQQVPDAELATDEHYRREFLGPEVAIKSVATLEEAVAHINAFGSHHTDAIVTSSIFAANRFMRQVDSAAVMVNASTRFNDGGELGLGAEIGISTDKFHARGPCGLRELTTYKWIVQGEGQVRT